MDGWKTATGGNVAAAAGSRLAKQTVDMQQQPSSGAHGSTAFMFQKRRVPINWRHLAGLDVDRVCRELDIQALQQNISNVTFCNIESEEFQGVDSNFIKLFRLAQLTIEYLLHSQQYLTDQKSQFEQQVQQLQKELELCQSEASARTDEIKTLKRENRKRRKMIEAYQDMLNQGATGLHPCPVCSKEFVSQQYLDSHMQRRHPNHFQPTPTNQGPNQDEIERRLMEQMNEKFHVTEQLLRQELARKESESLQSQAREFEQWKITQQENRKVELAEIQAPLLEQLRTVEQEKEHLQNVLQETKAEVEVIKRRSHSQPTTVDGIDHTTHETAPEDTASTDVKRLETKVVSKWKKHKKNVHKQMEQMNQSYHDKLLEISEKLASMEHSKQTESERKPRQQKQRQDNGIKKELVALQQRVMEQEQTLSSQKQQLESLQIREPSPASHASSNHRAERASPVDESQSEVSESSEEEEEEEEDEEEKEEMDFPTTPHFTPFPNRNTITTLYNHGQEAMDKIRRQTVTILDNALLQRGVTKDMVGLSDALLETKMKLMEAERQQRVQMHYQFMEQRERLMQEVESSTAANCHFQPPRNLFPSSPSPGSTPPHHKASPRRNTSPFRTPSPQQTSPQQTSPRDHRGSPRSQHSPTRQQSSPVRSQQPLSSSTAGGRVSSKPPTGLQSSTQQLATSSTGATHRQLQTDVVDSETDTTDTESESDSERSEERDDKLQPNSTTIKIPAGAVRVLPFSEGGMGRGRGGKGGKGRTEKSEQQKMKGSKGEGHTRITKKEEDEEEESSWDSEDSNDHITTQDLMSIPTSTPVQVLPVKTAKVSKTSQDVNMEEVSDNSWDVTETSNGTPPPRSKRNNGPSLTQKQTSNHSLTGGNSQSALTTVTQGDFDESDISDISTTQLT